MNASPHLDEAQIATQAAAFARTLRDADRAREAAEVHRADQEQARRERRHEQQERFDVEGLPRMGWERIA